MTFIIRAPNSFCPERQYLAELVFQDFLGQKFQIQFESRNDWVIALSEAGGSTIQFPDLFFQNAKAPLVDKIRWPNLPMRLTSANALGLPENLGTLSIPYALDGLPLIDYVPNKSGHQTCICKIDIFGTLFFQATRYTEHVSFSNLPPSKELEVLSHLPLSQLLIEMLRQIISRLWQVDIQPNREFEIFLSHDVDQPFGAYRRSMGRVLRGCARDFLIQKDSRLAWRRFKAKLKGSGEAAAKEDPFFTFDYLMTSSERWGLKSAFLFKAGVSDRAFDFEYELDSGWARELFGEINRRGHEIGFHPSYRSFEDSHIFETELNKLKAFLRSNNLSHAQIGGRQHYLGWRNPTTWRLWAKNGLQWDSTLGYADRLGFRSGLCRPYRAYDLDERKPLSLIERPLIIMETALIHRLKLAPDEILSAIMKVAKIVHWLRGELTVLWHNTNVASQNHRNLYQKTLQEISQLRSVRLQRPS